MLLFSQNSENAAYLWEFINGIQGRIWDHLLHPSVSPRGSPQAVSLSQSSQVLGRKFLLHGWQICGQTGGSELQILQF